jgi:hypothetical protein
MYPVVYFRKPKHVSESEFEELMISMVVSLPPELARDIAGRRHD